MTGIEKIIEKIEHDCKVSCDEILNNARVQEKVILDNAVTASRKDQENTLQTAADRCKTELALTSSRLDNEAKQAALAAKLEIINGIIQDAVLKLKNLPADEYFAVIETLAVQNAQQGDGLLRLSENDLKRLPQGFSIDVNRKLSAGKTITVSPEPVAIDGGFIIVYQDIEQNCSFDALLYENREKIKDELYAALFMRESV